MPSLPKQMESSQYFSSVQMMGKARAVIFNGFVFDELPPHVVAAAARQAQQAGAAIFFDPGPRAFSLQEGPRRTALDSILDIADVILMTQVKPLQRPAPPLRECSG